jgi:acyl carrier protein/SAM-dependent methyltransferase
LKRQRQFEAAWQALRTEAERQSQQGPLGWSPAGYAERWRALERLTRGHAQNVLVAAGAFADGMSLTAHEVLQRCGFQPIYLNLVRRWLYGLVAAGTLVQTDGTFRSVGALQPVPLAPYWEDVSRLLVDDPGALAYLRHCGMLLGDVLAGRKNALETLFPDGSFALAEGLYESSVEARYFNPIVASALRAIAHGMGKPRSVRILELGGGTGGTTSAVLPLLPARHVEYWFTDVSELFLSRARRKFGEYSYVHYARLDIDRPIEEQGFAPGMFDAVVAANVVHAARNLDSTLHRIKALLSADGMLVLLETTHHHSWFDMSTGLIEGWQHFEDSDRREHPLLTPEHWRGVLERTGFEDMMELPASGSPAVTLGQHVLLARCRRSPEIQSQGETGSKASAVQQQVRQAMLQASLREDRQSALAEELLSLPQEKCEQQVSQLVRETMCVVFQLDIRPENLTDRDRLSDLGMDSLIALELRGELSKKLGLGTRIPSTIAFDTGTVGELVRALAALLVSQTGKPLSLKASGEQPASFLKTERGYVTAEQLQTMSEEDVERLLTERLSR